MEIYRVAFFGHRKIYNIREIEERLVPILEDLICKHEFVEFYIGRNGEFDEFAASVIKSVQKRLDRDNSALILTLPYTVKDMEYYEEYYDEIVIPDVVSKAHPKGAITLRNKWIAETCDLVICYIEREEGGAYAAVKCANKLDKTIFNIFEKN